LATKTIFDLLDETPTFQCVESKKAGYTDEEIIAYLSESPSKDVFDLVEVSWSARVENFGRDYPIPFWSFVAVITICIAWVSIRCVWKLIKLMLYQTVYTIFKAIKDVECVKDKWVAVFKL
jgi:hypothetical protein